MTKSKSHDATVRVRERGEANAARVRQLAEAGADGQALTAIEVRAVCEALRSQRLRARNQFHSGV